MNISSNTQEYTLQDITNHINKLCFSYFDFENIKIITTDYTFTDFIAHNISKQTLLLYIDVCNNCQCCSRHTYNLSLPNLPAISKSIYEPDLENACKCDCRHLRRFFERAYFI